MGGDDDDLLRSRDPLYLIPTTYQPKDDGDHPPWMKSDVREHDHKLWLHRYKFFSHMFANKRAEQECQYYGSMSKQETMQIAQQAKINATAFPSFLGPQLDKKKFTYDATMERIIGDIQEKANRPGHMTKPLWSKYKYHSNNRERLEADYHQQEQDHLHTFKVMDLPVSTKTLNGARSSTDLVEQAAAKLDTQRRSKRSPQKSQSQGALGSAAAVMGDKSRTRRK